LRDVSATIEAVEKAISIIDSECVFLALGIHRAMRMRRILLPSVACPGLHYFSTLSPKWHDLIKRVTEHKLCVLIFCSTFVGNILILR